MKADLVANLRDINRHQPRILTADERLTVALAVDTLTKLPMTADSVRVLPGDTVYDLLGTPRKVVWDEYGRFRGYWVVNSTKDYRRLPRSERERAAEISKPCRPHDCYSTPEAAAEAAKGGGRRSPA